jgi:hypothetical protein
MVSDAADREDAERSVAIRINNRPERSLLKDRFIEVLLLARSQNAIAADINGRT